MRAGVLLHAERHRVGDQHETDPCGVYPPVLKLAVGVNDRVDVSLQHAGGVVEGTGLVHRELDRRASGSTNPSSGVNLPALAGLAVGSCGQEGERSGRVLAVLAAAGVGAVGGGGHRQHVACTGVGQRAHGLGDEGMPVAVADGHRHARAAPGELSTQGLQHLGVARVDRRDALEAPVVPGDLQEAGVRHAASGRGVAHEGQDVVGAHGAAVGQDEDRVVGSQRVGRRRRARLPSCARGGVGGGGRLRHRTSPSGWGGARQRHPR